MKKIINLDCDGTWIDLYGVEGWLTDLQNNNVRPYMEAKPLVNLSLLARTLNKKQKNGWQINIISWTSKNSNENFHEAVIKAKMFWLKTHIPSVHWDNIYIVPYGTPKHTLSEGYLFDDEENNRIAWGEGAYNEKDLISTIKKLNQLVKTVPSISKKNNNDIDGTLILKEEI